MFGPNPMSNGSVLLYIVAVAAGIFLQWRWLVFAQEGWKRVSLC